MTTQLVACPTAPLGGGDPTRRWGVRGTDGVVRWPGLTRPEADALLAELSGSDVRSDDLLVQVDLDVVLSDGAGPYLLDADGVLVLVVGQHPAGGGIHVAMGQLGPDRARIGAVRHARFAGGWSWIARAEAPGASRVAVLDALATAGDGAALHAWAARANAGGMP